MGRQNTKNNNAYLLVDSNDSSVTWLHFSCKLSNSVRGGSLAGAASAAMMSQIIYSKDIVFSDVSHKKIGSGAVGNYTLQQLPSRLNQGQTQPSTAYRPRALFLGVGGQCTRKSLGDRERPLVVEERLPLTFSRHGLGSAGLRGFVHGSAAEREAFTSLHGSRSGPIVSLPRKDVWGRRPRVRERPTRGPSRQIRKYVHEILECETCMYLASYFFGSSWLVCQGLINQGSVLESSRENALIVVLFFMGCFHSRCMHQSRQCSA